ncbi:protein crumbs homolog 3 isoform X3 [Choloepus didactylus]|uniref:protein crumbs homolog 3 isoform X3 n=1 Tax=Choloepus didactylus TaxID=27675 RepID=UPI00189DBD85|nr:protein crumbs homolog 3 isoform X3 [Choloepus didactylus]
MASPSLGLLLALGLSLLPACRGQAWERSPPLNWKQHHHAHQPWLQWGPVPGGHHRHHRGLLHPCCPAPGRGGRPGGAEAAREAADGGHLPAQQRGAVVPRS